MDDPELAEQLLQQVPESEKERVDFNVLGGGSMAAKKSFTGIAQMIKNHTVEPRGGETFGAELGVKVKNRARGRLLKANQLRLQMAENLIKQGSAGPAGP